MQVMGPPQGCPHNLPPVYPQWVHSCYQCCTGSQHTRDIYAVCQTWRVDTPSPVREGPYRPLETDSASVKTQIVLENHVRQTCI